MYCGNCGQKLNDDAMFCYRCGKAVNDNTNPAPEANEAISTPPVKKKKKSIFKRWWFWVIAIVVLFFACTGPADSDVEHPDVPEAEYKAMCGEIEFDQLARNPDNYEGQMFKFTGEVVQFMDTGSSYDLRLNVTAVEDSDGWVYYEDTIYVSIEVEEGADKILDYDIVTVYGVCSGAYTYESIVGTQVTLPRISAKYYELITK